MLILDEILDKGKIAIKYIIKVVQLEFKLQSE